MIITRDGKSYELTPEEKEETFREVDMNYMEEDAESHCEDFNQWHNRNIKFTSQDYSIIANRYSDRQDCEIPENAMYQQIVEDYVEETFNEDDSRKEDK